VPTGRSTSVTESAHSAAAAPDRQPAPPAGNRRGRARPPASAPGCPGSPPVPTAAISARRPPHRRPRCSGPTGASAPGGPRPR
jgi:hypothetical protein